MFFGVTGFIGLIGALNACARACVQVLRMPLFQLPQLITQLVNARVAMTRLQEFLSAPQQPPTRFLPPAEPGAVIIALPYSGNSIHQISVLS